MSMYDALKAEADARDAALWREQGLAMMDELARIATADPRLWDEDVRGQFREWAQNRARHALAAAREAAGKEAGK